MLIFVTVATGFIGGRQRPYALALRPGRAVSCYADPVPTTSPGSNTGGKIIFER